MATDPGLETELAAVDWSGLWTTRGSAAGLEEVIRELLTGDPLCLDLWISEWFGLVWHQGTRWSAAAPSVPIVVRALDSGSPDATRTLLGKLLLIATGFPSECLPSCRVPPMLLEHSGLAAYEAVNDAVPAVTGLLRHGHRVVRRSTSFFLGWFPDHAASSIGHLRSMLDGEEDPSCRAAATISIALLRRGTGAGMDDSIVAPAPGDAPAERAAKAIAAVLAAPEPSATAVHGLVDALFDDAAWPPLHAIAEDQMVASIAWNLVEEMQGQARLQASDRFKERIGLDLDGFKGACRYAQAVEFRRLLAQSSPPTKTEELAAWNDITLLTRSQAPSTGSDQNSSDVG